MYLIGKINRIIKKRFGLKEYINKRINLWKRLHVKNFKSKSTTNYRTLVILKDLWITNLIIKRWN